MNLKGLIRFKIVKEIKSKKEYQLNVKLILQLFIDDLNDKKEDLKFSDLELIFKDLKIIIRKKRIYNKLERAWKNKV